MKLIKTVTKKVFTIERVFFQDLSPIIEQGTKIELICNSKRRLQDGESCLEINNKKLSDYTYSSKSILNFIKSAELDEIKIKLALNEIEFLEKLED